MNDKERERHAKQMTDFRFKLVAELAISYLSSAGRTRMICEKAQELYAPVTVARRPTSLIPPLSSQRDGASPP